VNYAKHKGFDPEVATNWEKVSYKEICAFKVPFILLSPSSYIVELGK